VSLPIVCSAVLFWLGHLPYAAFNVGAAVGERGCTRGSGYVYGLLCQRSRSVWPAIGAHCAGNLIALVASAD
jgi:membrane protease YdiL (CAAX protease family)